MRTNKARPYLFEGQGQRAQGQVKVFAHKRIYNRAEYIRPKGFSMKYSELQVWQKAMDLVEKIYEATRNLPEHERFGLAAQMQRAAVSIPSNIAEGYSRASTKDYIKFLYIAKGSNAELQTQIIICKRLGYLDANKAEGYMIFTDEISRMLSAIILKLTQNS